jgi:uncharacterized damage-inducible protein DinB
MNELLSRLVAHMRWADALVADALDATPEADAVRCFAHVASVEHLWYSRIVGRPPQFVVWPQLSPGEARRIAAEHADLFERLVSASTEDTLAKIIAYRNSAGLDYESSVADIVTHTAMHGEHHRGQIARLIRAAGHEPPYTDYIQFTRRNQ